MMERPLEKCTVAGGVAVWRLPKAGAGWRWNMGDLV